MMWLSAVMNRATISRQGLDHLIDYLEVRAVQRVILYSASFLNEPAAWCVSVMTYPAEASCSWFLTLPISSQQALVISASHGRWHIVTVPKPPLVEAIVRDILLLLSHHGCLPTSKKIIIHERRGAADTMQRCHFEVHGVGYRVWHVGLFEDADGPFFALLSENENEKAQQRHRNDLHV